MPVSGTMPLRHTRATRGKGERDFLPDWLEVSGDEHAARIAAACLANFDI